ncbi:MAG: hypothetical protein KGH64_00235 [Candidatus Micrarchaeota archaeon]|nr:hypothetical protein [Candidatus Micrarchaeota archaeon]MDE1833743.1 hypothetical protein [Candidatus Micrarchaeota archaeon]MDE1859432.1 hypothetical protein [Candidatus Micrarchaeota archaeon]
MGRLPKPIFEITTEREGVDRLVTEQEALKIGNISDAELERIRTKILNLMRLCTRG